MKDQQEVTAQRNKALEEQLSNFEAQLSKFRETTEQVAKLQFKAEIEELFAQPSKVVFVSVCPPVTVFEPNFRSDFPCTKSPSDLTSEDKHLRAHTRTKGANFLENEDKVEVAPISLHLFGEYKMKEELAELHKHQTEQVRV